MARVKVLSAADAAALIPDGAVVTVSSSSGLGCPDAVLAAVGERFAASGHPRNLTTIHPIAAGDMYGIKGIDHIAQEGLLARVLAGSYPSGPSSAPSPAIWEMITADRIPAYNVPSGILFDLTREAAAKRPGVMTKVGLGTFVDPELQGCAMNARGAADPIVRKIEFAGDTWLFFPTIVPDVAIIRATTADERGNLSFEHEGAYLGPLDQALAVRNNGGIVIAQVKRLAKAGTLKPFAVHVPGVLVDVIVVAPDQMQTTQTVYDPAISGEYFPRRGQLPPHALGRRQGHRPARGAGAARRLGGQSGLRHLRPRAARAARGRPPRRRHLGDRAGCRGRRAAARLPVRLLGQRRGDHALAAAVHLLPGGRLRLLAAVVHADRP